MGRASRRYQSFLAVPPELLEHLRSVVKLDNIMVNAAEWPVYAVIAVSFMLRLRVFLNASNARGN